MDEKEEEDQKESDDIQVHSSLEQLYGPWLRVVDDRRGCWNDTFFTEVQPTSNNLLLLQAVSHRNRTYSRVPAAALPDFIDVVRPALETMVGALNSNKDELFTQALQSFLIIPQFALVKHPKETSSEIRHKLHEFREGPKESRAERKRQSVPSQPPPPEFGTLPPHMKKAIDQFKYQAAEGRLHKASQRLTQATEGKSGVLQPTEEVVRLLRELHPAATQPPEEPPDTVQDLPIVKKKLKMAAKRIANGSAADLFGWTGELLRHLIFDKKTFALVAEVVKAIRDGTVPDSAREWLLASWLIPLDKGEGKVRPIAGGSALVKLAAAYLMENVSERVKDTFRMSGAQYGLFMRDGTTAAAHITQLNLDRDSSHIAIKIDFANAFNTIPRKHILGSSTNAQNSLACTHSSIGPTANRAT